MPPKVNPLAGLLRGVKVDPLRDDRVNWSSWALIVRDVMEVQGIYCAAYPDDEKIAEFLGRPDEDLVDDAKLRRLARLVMLTHMEPEIKGTAMKIKRASPMPAASTSPNTPLPL